MNYKALKGMIDNLTKSYKCPECNSEVNESNVDIIGAAGTTINIDIECNNCGKHSMIKSEVITLDLTKIQNVNELKEKLKDSTTKKIEVNPKNLIKDEEIVELNKDLKQNNLGVQDLFKED